MHIEQATGNAEDRHFQTRDTRLPGPKQNPLIIKSADITAECRRPKGRVVTLDYGYGGDKHLYVEVGVYKPNKFVHWTHHTFDVQELIDGRRPESLKHLAKRLRVSQALIVACIVKHMHLPN